MIKNVFVVCVMLPQSLKVSYTTKKSVPIYKLHVDVPFTLGYKPQSVCSINNILAQCFHLGTQMSLIILSSSVSSNELYLQIVYFGWQQLIFSYLGKD